MMNMKNKTPIYDRRVSCEGKESMTQSVANQIAKKIVTRRDSERVRAYRCDFCGGWHIGSRQVQVPRAFEKRPRFIEK